MYDKLLKELQTMYLDVLLANSPQDIQKKINLAIMQKEKETTSLIENSLKRAKYNITREQTPELDNFNQSIKETFAKRSLITFLDKVLPTKIVRIYFYKKDGDLREMWCTRNHEILRDTNSLPKFEKTEEQKISDQQQAKISGKLTVFDVVANGWRVVDLSNLAYDIDKPVVSVWNIHKNLWLEISSTRKPEPKSFNTSLVRYDEEESYQENVILKYTYNSMMTNIIDFDEKDFKISKTNYLQQNPEVANELLKNFVVRAVFKKRDGTRRVMWCTKNLNVLSSVGIDNTKYDDEKEIGFGQFNVYDFEAEGMRKLTLNQLYLEDKEDNYMSFPVFEDTWVKVNEDETLINALQDEKEKDPIKEDISDFVYNGGTIINVNEPYVLESFKSALNSDLGNAIEEVTVEEETDTEADETVEDVTASSDAINGFVKLPKEAINLILQNILKDVRLAGDNMDFEYNNVYIYGKYYLNFMSGNPEVSLYMVDTEKNILLYEYRNLVFGIYPKGAIILCRKEDRVGKIIVNSQNTYSLKPENKTMLNNYLGLNNNFPIVDVLLRIDKFYTENTRKLALSSALANLKGRDVEKLQRVEKLVQIGDHMPRGTSAFKIGKNQNVEVLPSGFIRIFYKGFLFVIGDRRVYMQEENKSYYVLVSRVQEITSINATMEKMIAIMTSVVSTQAGVATATSFKAFCDFYLTQAFNLRVKINEQ